MASGPSSEDAGPLVIPGQVKWSTMTPRQKGRYMREVVTPRMRALFHAYDAEVFAKVGCSTCHGKSPEQRQFKMPNPELPQLPTTEAVFMKTVMKHHPKMVAFMGSQVTPEMAKLLGMTPFDPHAPAKDSFGCNGCHVMSAHPVEHDHP